VDRDLPDRAAGVHADPRASSISPTTSAQGSYFMAWFGTLVAVNLQTSFMTPPFGATLFYLKGTVPPGITMSDVYRAMWPFVAIQVVGLVLCMAFPEIVLWLPRIAGLLE
jgi:TRAP-type mannitol/chloroaromatic compound transport system permease large subunit